MARLSRESLVTEKIDGTNAQILITKLTDYMPTPKEAITIAGGTLIMAGSRTRWITPENDNFGFAAWVAANATDLLGLGEGRHYGEWWGKSVQRKYGQTQNHFSLFNALRWVEHDQEPGIIPTGDPRITKMQERAPSCCRVVPVLARGEFTTDLVEGALDMLRQNGSYAAPGFMNPEGVVVFHVAGNVGFKATLDGDGHKGR